MRTGQRILVSRIGAVERGEVVVFEDPGAWVPPQPVPGSGNDRGGSADSRCHLEEGRTAVVPLGLVTGRAVATVWPLGEAAARGVPSTLAAVPSPGPAPAEPVLSRLSTCPGRAAL